MNRGPVLLYDGTCGFCAGSVQLVLKHDHLGVLRFAALESAFGQALLRRRPELADIDSVLWVDHASDGYTERVLTHSAAALSVLAYLGGVWRLTAIAWLVPRPLRDAIYRLVAKHRHRLTSGGRQCLVPSIAERGRFLW
jgi:predicted DCC family thiol-disulfide oxidoreductase YuxK